MIKDQLIKARCTSIEKQYLIELMYSNKYKSLSETLRSIINIHMKISKEDKYNPK